MELNFWRRFFRTGVFTLVAYLVIGYLVVFSVILKNEVHLFSRSTPVTQVVSGDNDSLGHVSSQVRNVFGDPVPYAVIAVNNRLVQADNTGQFEIGGISPGRRTMEIFAGGYHRYEWEIQIEPGANTPIIKYDTGLWPEGFLPDFHVFFYDETKLFGIVGFANGFDYPLYLHKAIIIDPDQQPVMDLLRENGGLDYYRNLSSKLDVVSKPQPALKLPAKSWVSGELPPVPGPFDAGMYHLEVHFGNEKEHQKGQYRVVRITDHLDWDNNWNPHLP